MPDASNASGHNKPYTTTEEQILIYFKTHDYPWSQVTFEFNQRVDIDRQRTTAALESKWRQLNRLSNDEVGVP
ncbi:hypothetical protein N7492_002063 [Penicillium capsulatum]|uniref:Myb-like domain-containing protein n=1 Tax=Penicillium capsulatum TaxID=69766 RepID=A0A9W9LUS2_9EURO|nr:hypothetical protein N7492_002063 [Penicillium capsulatum]